MRKPRKKVVTLLLGVVALAVVLPLAIRWKDVYCRLFLDPQLVGQWETSPSESFGFEFDRVGNAFLGSSQRVDLPVGTYRIDGGSLIVVWSGEPPPDEWRQVYRVEGKLLTMGEGNNQTAYRRVPKARPRR